MQNDGDPRVALISMCHVFVLIGVDEIGFTICTGGRDLGRNFKQAIAVLSVEMSFSYPVLGGLASEH